MPDALETASDLGFSSRSPQVIFDNLFFQAAFLNLYLFTTSLMQGSSQQEASVS